MRCRSLDIWSCDNWRQSALVLSLPLPCSESLLITELLALLFPYVAHTLGLRKSLMDVLP